MAWHARVPALLQHHNCRGSSNRFFAFSPDLREIESIILILILETWLQGVGNGPCLPPACLLQL